MPDNGRVQIERLRKATAEDHDAVEGAMPLLGSGLTTEEYRSTLERVYGLVDPWEAFLLQHIPEPLRPFAEVRCRGYLLANDIEHLGGHPRELPRSNMPRLGSFSELLGAMYVMEGSRLGGQLLARGVMSHLGSAVAGSTSYFGGFGAQTGSMWKEFLDVLKDAVPDSETESTILGAKQMFACFGQWIGARPEIGTTLTANEVRVIL